MRVYRKTYQIKDTFPIRLDEEWTVMKRNKIAERWRVIEARKTQFTVQITEYLPAE